MMITLTPSSLLSPASQAHHYYLSLTSYYAIYILLPRLAELLPQDYLLINYLLIQEGVGEKKVLVKR
jgi:hypothetical protein